MILTVEFFLDFLKELTVEMKTQLKEENLL
jgi:hypothetical protein